MRSIRLLRGSSLAVALLTLSTVATAQGISTETKSAMGDSGAALPKIPEFDKLKTPQSPAFDILGLTPTTVERPTTPNAVATSALSSFVSGTQPIIPRQYALEVAPFWLVSHPTLTLRRMQQQTSMKGSVGHIASAIWKNIEETLTVSVATADSAFKTTTAQPTDTSISRLGFSVRFSPIRGHWIDGCIEAVEAPLILMSAEINRRIREAVTSTEMTAAQVEELNLQVNKEVRSEFAEKLKDPQRTCLATRRGFMLDFAAAGVGRYPQQSFTSGRFSAYGIWATGGYDAGNVTVLGIARTGKDGSGDKFLGRSFTDLGGRLVGAWDQYALSAEAVNRATRESIGNDNSWRVTAGFDVKVSPKVWLNTSFGHDFRTKDARSLLALANLQWNFGDAAIESPANGSKPPGK